MTLNDVLRKYNVRIDDSNRVYLSCLCDGTFLFLWEMLNVIEHHLNCTDIKSSTEIINDRIPSDKPWCRCLYTVSGILPTEFRGDK